MPPKLLVAVYGSNPPWKLEAEHVDAIRRAAGRSFEVVQAADNAALEAALPEAEVMYGFRLRPETLPLARRLRWVQATSAGVNNALYPEFMATDVMLTSAAGIHAVQISEHALAMMLAFARGLNVFIRRQADRQWERPHGDQSLGELFEKTLGIVGMGQIGEALAARAKAFGMRVIGLKGRPEGYKGLADEVLGPDGLERLMRESDYVIALLPQTAGTAGLVSAQAIDAMKPGSYFINLGRGKTVDENALVRALADKRIAGAGLDVFETEPLPEESPLWGMENVIITPHTAGQSPRYWERATALFIENLRRYMRGEGLMNLVDKRKGY
jgi:phosphoglycerate dehydrogenase-like enzyme